MADNTKIERKTFYSLLYGDDNKIYIPRYQRSYAQGRKRWDSGLEEFLKDIKDVLDKGAKDDSFNMDFVYGGEDEGFSPVDGQQRLTLLFLIHWYVFSVKNKAEDIKKLEKFKYEARESTGLFCNNLVKNHANIIPFDDKGNIQIDIDTKLSAIIRDQGWFTLEMSEDPSIQSMLYVIDKIHKLYFTGVIEPGNKWEDVLTKNDENNPLWFYHANKKLGKIKSTREKEYILDLYTKMNARGVRLTGFENVKAGLEKSDLLKEIAGVDPEKRIELIGRINTKYSNLLFKVCDCDGDREPDYDAVLKSDRATMEILRRLVWINYVSEASYFYPFGSYFNELSENILNLEGADFSRFLDRLGMEYYAFDELRSEQKGIIEGKLGKQKPDEPDPSDSEAVKEQKKKALEAYEKELNKKGEELIRNSNKRSLKKALKEFFIILDFAYYGIKNGKENTVLTALFKKTGKENLAQDDSIILLLLAEFVDEYTTKYLDKSDPVVPNEVLESYRIWEQIISKCVRNTGGIKSIDGYLSLYTILKQELLDKLTDPITPDGIYDCMSKWAENINRNMHDAQETFRKDIDALDKSVSNVSELEKRIKYSDFDGIEKWFKTTKKEKKGKKTINEAFKSFKLIKDASGHLINAQGTDGGIVEELIKAQLISKDKRWKKAIETAENAIGSSIWFMLDMAKDDLNNYGLSYVNPFADIDDDFKADLATFNTSLELTKELFDKEGIKKDLYPGFEKVVISYSKPEETHLRSRKDKALLLQNEKYKEEYLSFAERNNVSYRTILQALKDLREEMCKGVAIDKAIEKIKINRIKGLDYSALPDWKKCFLEHGLIECFSEEIKMDAYGRDQMIDCTFMGGFEPNLLDGKYTALLRTKLHSQFNMEMWSFALAIEIKRDEGVNSAGRVFYYIPNQNQATADYIVDIFPNRYIVLTKESAKVKTVDWKLYSDGSGKDEKIKEDDLTKIGYIDGKFYIKEGRTEPKLVEFGGKVGSFEAAKTFIKAFIKDDKS